MWYNFTEIPQEKCFTVDSVYVRIDRGLFGMKTMTNNIRIVESNNCKHSEIDTTDLSKSHYKIGHELAKKRCFTGAIYHYTICSELDTLNNDCYYHRGLMYMAKENYEKALVDFYTAAYIKYSNVDNKGIQFIREVDIQSYMNELFNMVENKDFENIAMMAENISNISDFDNYQERIKMCIKKISEN
jgi:tetratricopeptide (TPR) repeat protein